MLNLPFSTLPAKVGFGRRLLKPAYIRKGAFYAWQGRYTDLYRTESDYLFPGITHLRFATLNIRMLTCLSLWRFAKELSINV